MAESVRSWSVMLPLPLVFSLVAVLLGVVAAVVVVVDVVVRDDTGSFRRDFPFIAVLVVGFLFLLVAVLVLPSLFFWRVGVVVLVAADDDDEVKRVGWLHQNPPQSSISLLS
jgi:drug/metabolite transporter (DMT)-like permease